MNVDIYTRVTHIFKPSGKECEVSRSTSESGF